MKKYLIWILVAVAILFLGYWFVVRPNLMDRGPSKPPTAEELQRMREIEESSSQIAPNAVPGAGVRPVGSLPRTPEPTPAATGTEEATNSETAE